MNESKGFTAVTPQEAKEARKALMRLFGYAPAKAASVTDYNTVLVAIATAQHPDPIAQQSAAQQSEGDAVERAARAMWENATIRGAWATANLHEREVYLSNARAALSAAGAQPGAAKDLLDAAIQHAAENLPEGWSIQIEVEHWAGTVAMRNPDNDVLEVDDFGSSDDGWPEQIRSAVRFALASQSSGAQADSAQQAGEA